MFSAVSWAAESPFSWVESSFDLNPGAGDAAAEAAPAAVSVDLDMAVAPSTPPKIMAAATTEATTRVRVVIMGRYSAPNLKTSLESGVSFGARLLLPAD